MTTYATSRTDRSPDPTAADRVATWMIYGGGLLAGSALLLREGLLFLEGPAVAALVDSTLMPLGVGLLAAGFLLSLVLYAGSRLIGIPSPMESATSEATPDTETADPSTSGASGSASPRAEIDRRRAEEAARYGLAPSREEELERARQLLAREERVRLTRSDLERLKGTVLWDRIQEERDTLPAPDADARAEARRHGIKLGSWWSRLQSHVGRLTD